MRRGVVYQFTKDRHAAVLLTSLMSLGKHYSGRVLLVVGDSKAEAVASQLLGDPRITAPFKRISAIRWDAPTHPRQMGYANKTRIAELCPYAEGIFLDADTLVVGSLDELWPERDLPVTLTRFSNWSTCGQRMKRRLEGWRKVAPHLVKACQNHSWPAINTGVFAWNKAESAPFFAEWNSLCLQNVSFICDELSAQLLVGRDCLETMAAGYKYPVAVRVLDDRFNASPVYSWNQPGFICENVRIWHFHGRKHIRHPRGRALWVPWWRAAWDMNLGNVQSWAPAGDQHLAAWMNDPKQYERKH